MSDQEQLSSSFYIPISLSSCNLLCFYSALHYDNKSAYWYACRCNIRYYDITMIYLGIGQIKVDGCEWKSHAKTWLYWVLKLIQSDMVLSLTQPCTIPQSKYSTSQCHQGSLGIHSSNRSRLAADVFSVKAPFLQLVFLIDAWQLLLECLASYRYLLCALTLIPKPSSYDFYLQLSANYYPESYALASGSTWRPFPLPRDQGFAPSLQLKMLDKNTL